ncbi:nucleoside hydrolase [Calothrix sp. FACHB-1219]|uniref:nucleoside hydrolase n=1 Tax=unclassified Calothrix TaxID=2619626 RepID=UPI0016893BB2|nr:MULTISPECIES: nucleoside hydrolase [unclassified Calothrix]MBD2203625.1 nucleoside hydrolase [Calothrix sp. FACHB-168]MBD2219931.1 nucleoside hydrolase [Calothrix sp. FACHB-1219]
MANNHISHQSIPLIIDDDGSQDGMTALAFMLENPKFDIKAITIAQGIAKPEIFVNNLAKMLTRLGNTDIPVGIGRSTPLEGNNAFPDFIRDGSNTFWAPFVTLPDEAAPIQKQDAVDLIIETIKNSPEPVAILATGTLTNIAEALRRDPSIIDNIKVVEILGGAVFVPGNLPVLPFPPFSTNKVAEFNIWVDPVAAQEVFEAGKKGLKIQLTPLDATGKIEFNRDDYEAWLLTGTAESKIAAEFLDFALTVIQSGNDPNPVWDLVAAINLSEANFSPETPLHIKVDTKSDPGTTQGQTKPIAGLSPNALVALDPSFDNLPFSTSSLFKYIDALNTLPKNRVKSGTSRSDTLVGNKKDELISGLNGNDTIYGNGGNDILLAGGGKDTIVGGFGNDFIDGGSGSDRIYGNGGKDTLIGGTGDDSIFGGAQADIILGGTGNDRIYGNGGKDIINSGTGFDTIWLGRGAATVVLAQDDGYDSIKNFRLGATKFQVSSLSNLSFADSSDGVKILQNQELIAVVSGESAHNFSTNISRIFVVSN